MTSPDSTGKNASNPVAIPPSEPAAAIDAGRSSESGASKRPREIGGPSGLEPTRYGDWERNGRVSDF